MSTTQWEAVLTMPVTEDWDHIQGACGCGGDARPVRRLRMSVLRCRIPQHQGGTDPDRWEAPLRLPQLPDNDSHPHAEQAAEAAEAAASQGKFWPMHDLLYENQKNLRDQDLRGYAEQLGLDVGVFDKELAEHVHAERVHEDFMSGVRSGVNGTPTFYINGARHDDSYEFETLLAAVERATASERGTR